MTEDNRDSTEIDLHIDEIEKEVKRLLIHQGVITDEYNKLRRDEIILQQKKLEVTRQKQEIKIRIDKSRSIIGDMEAEIKLERRMFWLAKNSGL